MPADPPDPHGAPRIGRWLRGYGLGDFRHDLVAGLSVAVLLIPQSMAYAHLAGAPPVYGLYASVVPLLVYAALGTSYHLAVGVVAIDMLIVGGALAGVAEPGSERWVSLAVLLALLVGATQVLMSLARLGFLVTLLSRPVMVGFTSGAAVLIALSQVGPLMGIDTGRAQVLPTLLWMMGRGLDEARLAPLLMGGAAVAALLAFRRWRPGFPAALLVVAAGAAVVAVFGPEAVGVELVGDVPHGLPAPRVPEVDLATVRGLIPTVLALALVQFTTVSSLGKVFAARFGYPVGANRELMAVGSANLVGSFFRALPVSGSFSRTALNADSGARTPAANAVTAAAVALALLLFSSLLSWVPVPVLAALILVSVLTLVDVQEIRFLRRAKTVDGWIAVVTLLATLGAGPVEGILVGVAGSLLALLYRISRPNAVELGHLPGTRSFRDPRVVPDARPLEGLLLLRIDASFSFMNAEFLKDFILDRTAGEHPSVRAVVLDASSVNDLDMTAGEVLVTVKERLDERRIPLYFGGVKEPVLETLRRSGLGERIGPERFFLSPHRAVTHVLEDWGEEERYLRNVPGGGEG